MRAEIWKVRCQQQCQRIHEKALEGTLHEDHEDHTRHLDTSTKAQMAKIVVQYGRSGRSFRAKSVRSSLAGLLWERKFEESSIWTRLGKVPNWDCLFVNWEEGLLLSVYVDDIKLAGKKQKHWPTVENTCERSRFGRTNILLWPRLFGLHSKRMRNEQRYCGQLQKCLSPKSLMERQKSYLVQGNLTQTSLHGPMICKEMCGAILRVGEQNNPATVQSYNSMPWWPSIQRRRVGICWRIVIRMLSNCPEMPVLRTHW